VAFIVDVLHEAERYNRREQHTFVRYRQTRVCEGLFVFALKRCFRTPQKDGIAGVSARVGA
jgi:hypothetical protein